MRRTRKKIRILVADDHTLMRTGLRLLLDSQPDMEVVGEASDGRETVSQATALSPDVVLLDLSMPNVNGIQALRMLRHRLPEARILVLTMHDDDGYVRRVLEAGGAGYLVKEAADLELLSAIRAVARGETYVHSSLTGTLLKAAFEVPAQDQTESPDAFSALSERKKEVLRLLAHGYTYKEVAEKLRVSVKTVETYRARLMEDLNLRTRAELVRYAVQQGLLSFDE